MGHRSRLAVALLEMLLARAVDALAPPACAACDERLGRPAAFCRACAATVERAEAGTGAGGKAGAALEVSAFGLYGGALATALRRLKYDERPELARPLGLLLRSVVRAEGLAADVVVPVPLHPRRLVERGYNQAALLGAHVAAELGAPLAARALSRVRPTEQQAGLDRAARLGNLEGVFRARAPAAVGGRRVLLVDDVATTGATLAGCAEALREAGAGSVAALVMARAA